MLVGQQTKKESENEVCTKDGMYITKLKRSRFKHLTGAESTGAGTSCSDMPEMIEKYSDQYEFKCSKNTIISYASATNIKFKQLWNLNCCKKQNVENSFVRKDFQVMEPRGEIIEEIVKYDTTVSHLNREKWRLNWPLNHVSGRSLVALKKVSPSESSIVNDQSTIAGFGQIRELDFCNVVKISPLYADNVDVAREILVGLLALYLDVGQKEVQVHYLEKDTKTENILKEFGFEKRSGFIQLMFTEHDLEYNADKVFFLAEPEINFV
uniref:YitH acetyltransferase (GNAT) domain-containing protein n=1 Tax=Romanomermis culicivorax TaxID=13658 RepID=A0A915HNG9_ROMCU